MNVTVLYVGSSLLGPLRNAERELNRAYKLDLHVAAYNFGSPLSDREWLEVEADLKDANIVFVIHVMDGENAMRLISALDKSHHDAIIVINCMPELMRRTRMGRLDIAAFKGQNGKGGKLLRSVGSWVGNHARRGKSDKRSHTQYLKLVDRLPGVLQFVPTAGALTDAKHYLYLFCYFLQPTPANIQSMLLYALVHYVSDARLKKIRVAKPEQMPSVAIYHPKARALFRSFAEYRKWYGKPLHPDATIGLLLMRPQVISKTTKHYDALINSIEAEGLSVIPAIATLMDNREAVAKFFVEPGKTDARVSQIVSLTGFSFVGGPAMNDSAAAAQFLRELNLPYRSAVSLDTQTIEAWSDSATGLNPVQAGMQIAIPEIDGATEPFIYGGIPSRGHEPVALEDRCRRLARRLKRWHRLQSASRDQVKLAIALFCFPPNKGNIGTAADLDVFPGLFDVLKRLRDEGYAVELPDTIDDLRDSVADNIAYRMNIQEYRRLCPYVTEVERDWGRAPGFINIQGLTLGNVFIGVQPTFGYEGDPMRLMMARSGSPHHGFMGFYTYLAKVWNADGVIHFGTHGALEFMPGKQIGLSGECWPDRLIDELPNFYIYSVNNPSEGSIAKRRSYAELISYLTPPIENAGLYRDLANLKDLVMSYRQSTNEVERTRLYQSIEELRSETHF